MTPQKRTPPKQPPCEHPQTDGKGYCMDCLAPAADVIRDMREELDRRRRAKTETPEEMVARFFKVAWHNIMVQQLGDAAVLFPGLAAGSSGPVEDQAAFWFSVGFGSGHQADDPLTKALVNADAGHPMCRHRGGPDCCEPICAVIFDDFTPDDAPLGELAANAFHQAHQRRITH